MIIPLEHRGKRRAALGLGRRGAEQKCSVVKRGRGVLRVDRGKAGSRSRTDRGGVMLGLRGGLAPSASIARLRGAVPSRAFAADKPSHPQGLQYYISSYLMPQVRTGERVQGRRGRGRGRGRRRDARCLCQLDCCARATLRCRRIPGKTRAPITSRRSSTCSITWRCSWARAPTP